MRDPERKKEKECNPATNHGRSQKPMADLNAISVSENQNECVFSNREWTQLTDLAQLLQPLQEATDLLQGEHVSKRHTAHDNINCRTCKPFIQTQNSQIAVGCYNIYGCPSCPLSTSM